MRLCGQDTHARQEPDFIKKLASTAVAQSTSSPSPLDPIDFTVSGTVSLLHPSRPFKVSPYFRLCQCLACWLTCCLAGGCRQVDFAWRTAHQEIPAGTRAPLPCRSHVRIPPPALSPNTPPHAHIRLRPIARGALTVSLLALGTDTFTASTPLGRGPASLQHICHALPPWTSDGPTASSLPYDAPPA